MKKIATILLLMIAMRAGSQTLVTDSATYSCGSTVTLTGSGFFPSEEIDLMMWDNAGGVGGTAIDPSNMPIIVFGDGGGNFIATWIVTSDGIGLTILAHADGQLSGSPAEVTFDVRAGACHTGCFPCTCSGAH